MIRWRTIWLVAIVAFIAGVVWDYMHRPLGLPLITESPEVVAHVFGAGVAWGVMAAILAFLVTIISGDFDDS